MNDTQVAKIRVLLCEDEPLILMATSDLLKEFGMDVLEAGSAAAALTVLTASDVDVLVTDVGLPDLNGVDLALQARKLKPRLPIAFSTGDRQVDGIEAIAGAVILPKPCPDEELVAAITALALGAGAIRSTSF